MKLAQNLALFAALAGAPSCKHAPDSPEVSVKVQVVEIQKHVAADVDQATSTPQPAPPLSEATLPLEARLAKFHAHERKLRDRLFENLMGGGRELSIIDLLQIVPLYEHVYLRSEPLRREMKSALHFLFDLSLGSKAANFHYYIDANEDSLNEYKKSVAEKGKELNLDPVYYMRPTLAPFYDSVRNPSDDDLRRLHKILTESILARVVAEEIPKGIFNKAKKLIDKKPELCESELIDGIDGVTSMTGEGCDPKTRGQKVEYTRAADGELKLPENSGAFNYSFVDEEGKKASPFEKFLFRRGRRFTHNAHVFVHAWRKTRYQGADTFIEAVRKWIPNQEQDEARP